MWRISIPTPFPLIFFIHLSTPMMDKQAHVLSLACILLFLLSLSHQARVVVAQRTPAPVHVGVVLDLQSSMGKRSLTTISMALDDFYFAYGNYTTRVVLHKRDSEGDVIGAASAALDLLENVQVQAIIGPQSSAQAHFVADLLSKTQVPVLSFSATSPTLSSARAPYLVRTSLNDSSQVTAVAALVRYYGWREVVPVYEDTDYGTGVIPSLIDALQGVDARVPYRSVIPPSPTNEQISAELYKLMTRQTRVFFVHMLPDLAIKLFKKAATAGMMSPGYVWITTYGITDVIDLMDSAAITAMQGVLGVRPYVPRPMEHVNFTVQWTARHRLDNSGRELADLSAMQLWAYDTAWALAMAVETAGVTGPDFKYANGADNSTGLARLGIAQTGRKLLASILNTKFNGTSGEFRLVNGQLQSSPFEIVNVVEKRVRKIGYWTPAAGLSQKLNSTHDQTRSAVAVDLKNVTWPGNPTSVPKGWEIPPRGKKLWVGVPVKKAFHQFVKVDWDPTTNRTNVSGYCIDVFDAVMKSLPYAVPYEYIPYGDAAQQKPAGSYDEMVYQVYLQKFDAVVGDTGIVANRSLYVDFTFPYMQSGVSMIVPIKGNKSKNTWIFLKPLTKDLWLGSLAFFFFTGFVVWVIEHRINEEFRGRPYQHLGTTFYFAFSTLVFAHREKLESNLSRFIVIIWVFVLLILTSSYKASLTSMLTVQQLQPTVTDVNELLKNGDYVGHQNGSFVLGLLKQTLKFDEHRLKSYSSPEQYIEALSSGSVAAIFGEIPYVKIILSGHCADYTVVGPTYKTDGFGFAFPRGSPLAPDVSRAILSVTEGGKMADIERKWFGDQTACPAESSSVGSSTLNFQSFGGLFLITGSVSLLALIVFFAMFICKNWDELKAAASENSLWRRIVAWARHYDRKDLTSPAFKKDAAVVVNDGERFRSTQTPQGTLNADNFERPISTSDLSDFNCGTPEEKRPSTELSDPFVERPAASADASMEIIEISGGY